ncbi:hypothetical protein [Streptomyces sp. NPDC055632]
MSDLVGDARHLSPSAQEALRLRAVAGRDREDVAAMFGVSLSLFHPDVPRVEAQNITAGQSRLKHHAESRMKEAH